MTVSHDVPGRLGGSELASKLATLRESIAARRLGGIRLRRHDWFAWATCGGSNSVLATAVRGVAEVFVTRDEAVVLADTIDGGRLREEEVPVELAVVAFAWARPGERERFVRAAARGRPVASDLPGDGELALPPRLWAARRTLQQAERDRYRCLGREAAEAATEALSRAAPEDSERDLAASAAAALWRRGIDPALVLVGGQRRALRYRHPTPTAERLGARAMLVLCGRRHGLYANLTRFVAFRPPTAEERRLSQAVAGVEAAAFAASTPDRTLGDAFAAIVAAYELAGHGGAEREHHQGGLSGYLSREVLAVPGSRVRLQPWAALAWNPSLRGVKVEDTVLVAEAGLEVLTCDPAWPTMDVAGRPRPDVLVRG